MKSKKRQYSILLILSVFFLAFSMSTGTTVVGTQSAQASEQAAVKRAPAKCPDPKPITINIPTSALLMLHWQNDLIKPEGKLSKPWRKRIQKDNTIGHAQAVLKAAREKGMFIIFVNIGYRPGYPEVPPKKYLKGFIKRIVEEKMLKQGTWGAANIDELKPLKSETLIWNYTASAFESTALDRILRNRGIKSLFLSGIATNYVVENTMRRARDLGYKNNILMDCCNTWSQDVHCWPLANTMGHMAVVTDLAHFIEALKSAK